MFFVQTHTHTHPVRDPWATFSGSVAPPVRLEGAEGGGQGTRGLACLGCQQQDVPSVTMGADIDIEFCGDFLMIFCMFPMGCKSPNLGNINICLTMFKLCVQGSWTANPSIGDTA